MEKPKRKYTLTEKALAANRRNLIRAREVDTEIRFRTTPKRLAACRANLIRAHEALRAASLTPDGYPRKSEITNQKSETGDAKLEHGSSKSVNRQWPDSPAYGTGYTRGLYAVSLRRSGRLAGEPDGAFDAHVARFVAALDPRNQREQRLARGIAQTVWRRLRAFRGQARYERACLSWLLQRVVDGRDLLWLKNGRPGPGPFAEDGKDKPLSAAQRAANLAWEIDHTLASDLNMLDAAEKLNVRLERLSRLWVVGRGGDPRLFQFAAPGRMRDGLLAGRSPESMGNPLQYPCVVSARMAERMETPLQNFSPAHARRGPAWGWIDPVKAAEYYTRFDLMREIYRSMPPDETGGAGLDAGTLAGSWPALASLPALMELWARTWQAISIEGYTSHSVTVPGFTSPATGHAGPGTENNSSSPEEPSLPVTQALWSRLQVYAEAAKKESSEVDFLLEAKINGRMRSEFQARLGKVPGDAQLEPPGDEETGVFLMELILLFNRTRSPTVEQRTTGRLLCDSLREFLTGEFGPNTLFDPFKATTIETQTREWIDRRRDVLERQWAQNQAALSRPPAPGGGPLAGIQRAEENVKLAAELAALATFATNFEQELLDSRSDDLVDMVRADSAPDPEWTVRYLAAASTGMLILPDWKYESAARCRERVGLGRAERRSARTAEPQNGKRLKAEG